MTTQDLIERLRKRAEIRRQIPTRKSVQEGKPDRIADLLDEAADCIEAQESKYQMQIALLRQVIKENGRLKSRLDGAGE